MSGVLSGQFAIGGEAGAIHTHARFLPSRPTRVALEAGWILGAISAARPDLEAAALRGPVWRGRFSTVFRAEGAGGYIAVKVCFEPGTRAPSETAARREFEALERAASLSHRGLITPRPIGILPRHGLVLTEWLEGERLSRVLRRRDAQACAAALAGAARWVARLHASTADEWRPVPTARVLEDVEERFGLLRQSDGLARAGLRALEDAAPRISEQPVRWGPLHGDFKPANLILIPSGQVAALDIGLQAPGPVLTDIAHFLNHVRLLRVAAPAGAFLDAYIRESGQVIDTAPLTWLRLAGALRLLSRPGPGWVQTLYAISARRTRALIAELITSRHG